MTPDEKKQRASAMAGDASTWMPDASIKRAYGIDWEPGEDTMDGRGLVDVLRKIPHHLHPPNPALIHYRYLIYTDRLGVFHHHEVRYNCPSVAAAVTDRNHVEKNNGYAVSD